MRARRSFRDVFRSDPAAGARTPGRVNLMGDHTDYNGGFVLPTVIPQETLVEIAFGEGVHQLYSANFDRMVRFGSGALTDFARYVGGCVRVLEQRGIEIPPLNFYVASNVPVGAGLSSSAALEIATLRALDCMLGLGLTSEEVARLAHRAEVGFAGVACGIMDQFDP
jgi:galactokinase